MKLGQWLNSQLHDNTKITVGGLQSGSDCPELSKVQMEIHQNIWGPDIIMIGEVQDSRVKIQIALLGSESSQGKFIYVGLGKEKEIK